MNRPMTAAALVAVIALTACGSHLSTGAAAPVAPSEPPTASTGAAVAPIPPASTTSAATTTPAATPSSAQTPARAKATPLLLHGVAAATKRLRALVTSLGDGGVSIEAYRPDNGARFDFGASAGMACGSITKLFILETLLLQHQDDHTALTADERALADSMITESDNAAADTLYADIGEGPALRAAARRLGVEHTVPGNDLYWGFTTTSARDFVALLAALTHNGSLNAASRAYALSLLRDVDGDQHWGVSAAADNPTKALVKDGWLASSRDDARWLVNSVGMITVHGHRVLIAVLTQHGASFDGGIDLVEKLARISATVVA